MISNDAIQEIYEECVSLESGPFGCWINSLFGLIAARASAASFCEIKEVFFAVLTKLVEERRAILSPPPCIDDVEPGYYVISDGYSVRQQYRKACRTEAHEANRFWVWNVPIDRQISHFRSTFPKDVSDPEDAELNLYWYLDKCPRIGWLHPETGVLYAS